MKQTKITEYKGLVIEKTYGVACIVLYFYDDRGRRRCKTGSDYRSASTYSNLHNTSVRDSLLCVLRLLIGNGSRLCLIFFSQLKGNTRMRHSFEPRPHKRWLRRTPRKTSFATIWQKSTQSRSQEFHLGVQYGGRQKIENVAEGHKRGPRSLRAGKIFFLIFAWKLCILVQS